MAQNPPEGSWKRGGKEGCETLQGERGPGGGIKKTGKNAGKASLQEETPRGTKVTAGETILSSAKCVR